MDGDGETRSSCTLVPDYTNLNSRRSIPSDSSSFVLNLWVKLTQGVGIPVLASRVLEREGEGAGVRPETSARLLQQTQGTQLGRQVALVVVVVVVVVVVADTQVAPLALDGWLLQFQDLCTVCVLFPQLSRNLIGTEPAK